MSTLLSQKEGPESWIETSKKMTLQTIRAHLKCLMHYKFYTCFLKELKWTIYITLAFMVHELTECPCKLISIMLFVLCPWDIICVWTGLVLFLMIWWKQASKWDMLLLNGQNLLQILRSRKRKCTEVKVLLWQLNTLLNRKTSLRIKYELSVQGMEVPRTTFLQYLIWFPPWLCSLCFANR